jgi:tetratricopeptide (TPR) repeat protein
MIVRNESKIIVRLLQSVLGFIDSYCICDTGSTDNTIEIIETFFSTRGIPGIITHQEFRDFGYNRTFALNECVGRTNADYILLLDADMVFVLNPEYIPIIKQKLIQFPERTAFYIFQGSTSFHYKNVRIVKNNCGMKYWGVTHEYVEVPEGTQYRILEKELVFIHDVGDGGSKTNKFYRDIKLLTKGLEDFPNNDRYTFYLANSYRDVGFIDKAIEMYIQRIQLGGWFEEVWFSHFQLGKLYHDSGKFEYAISHWIEAFGIFPYRIENLYELVKYYRIKGNHQIAVHFYILAKTQMQKFPIWDYLFLEKSVYDYKLDYEFTILGFYFNPYNIDMSNFCMKLCFQPVIEEWMITNILSNYKFYAYNLSKLENVKSAHIPSVVHRDLHFVSSTPSICYHNSHLVLNTRYVNYKIDDKGEYINCECIWTINRLYSESAPLKCEDVDVKTNEELMKESIVLLYNQTHDNSVYAGLEDVRLFSFNDKLFYNANRGLGHRNMMIEHGEIDTVTGNTNSVLVRYKDQSIEKNWVLFENNRGEMKCIYKWNPLTIGDIVHESTFKTPNGVEPSSDTYADFIVSNTFTTNPMFDKARGSTNGVKVLDEIWFIIHYVSYETRRYYYHMMVAMDPATYRVKRATPIFTFTGEKVEYTLGFVFESAKSNDVIKIGYSVMDRTTEYIDIPRTWFESKFISL